MIASTLQRLGCIAETCSYLGDGVYAGIDFAGQVWLVTEGAEGVHTIALDGSTMNAFEEYTFKHADKISPP